MQTLQSPPKLNSKRMLVRLFCLLTVFVLSLLLKNYYFLSLPRGAYPVLSTARWAGRNPRWPQDPTFHWLANGDIAYLETSLHGTLQVCYQKMDSKGPVGAVRRGPELPATSEPGWFFPSPDEQWVVYMQTAGPFKNQTVLVSADGTTTRPLPGKSEEFRGWLPDSRSYLVDPPTHHGSLKVYHLDSSQEETMLSADEHLLTPLFTPTHGPNFLIGGRDWYSHKLPNGHIAVHPTMTVESHDNTQPAVIQQQWAVPIPADMDVAGAHVSPDNQHLLWTAIEPAVSYKWRRRLFPATPTVLVNHRVYFLSDLHGNNMHPILNDSLGGTHDVIARWTPDGKHLSFVYKERVYLVPVD